MFNKPTSRLGEEHAKTKNDSRYHLKTPRSAEGSNAADVGPTELEKALGYDTPSNGPLLDRPDDHKWRGGEISD